MYRKPESKEKLKLLNEIRDKLVNSFTGITITSLENNLNLFLFDPFLFPTISHTYVQTQSCCFIVDMNMDPGERSIYFGPDWKSIENFPNLDLLLIFSHKVDLILLIFLYYILIYS